MKDGMPYGSCLTPDQRLARLEQAGGAWWVWISAATQSFGPALETIEWTAEEYDPLSMHDNAINNSRITVKAPGWYSMDACLLNVDGAYGAGMISFSCQIRVNGSNYIGVDTTTHTGTGQPTVKCHAEAYLNAGDYIEVLGSRSDGFFASAVGGNKGYSRFVGHWVRP